MKKGHSTLILLVCFMAAFSLPASGQVQSTENLKALNEQLQQLYSQRNYTEAVPLAEKILSLTERKYGRNHEDTANALTHVADLYYLTGKRDTALQQFRKALEIYFWLGENYPYSTTALANLLKLYRDTGWYAETEPLFMRALKTREEKLGEDSLDVAIARLYLAVLYNEAGRYVEAEPLYRKALETCEKRLGGDHPGVATIRNNLAILYYKTGRYAEAEAINKEALTIREKKLGENHPDVATSLNSLAVLYRDTGRYEEAEQLFKRALAIRELGGDHLNVAASLTSLALLYCDTGRYEEAEQLFKQALKIKENKLPNKDDPNFNDDPNNMFVADSLSNMAVLYRDTGRYEQAERLFDQSMQKRFLFRKGEGNPEVAQSFSDMALLYQLMGDYINAKRSFERALEIRRTISESDDPSIATALDNLAMFYRVTGYRDPNRRDTSGYDMTEELFMQALEIREKKLGKDHPDVATTLNNMALLYCDTGQYAKAEKLFMQALEIREKKLGENHPDVAATLNNLALLYLKTGRYDKAEKLFMQALGIREKKLVKDHLDVAATLNNMALLYCDTGRYAEAEKLFTQALEIKEKKLGKDHLDVAATLNNLALLYRDTGRYEEAEKKYKEALAIYESKIGKDYRHIDLSLVLSLALSLNNLAELYSDAGRYVEAEQLYKRSLEIYEYKQIYKPKEIYKATYDSKPGKEHLDVATTLNNLAGLYQATGRYAEAEAMYKEALEIREDKLGKDHPDVIICLENLAILYGKEKQYESSYKYLLKSMDRAKRHDYLSRRRGPMDVLLTLTSRYLPPKEKFVTETHDSWLVWNGITTKSPGSLTEANRLSGDPAVREQFRELTEVRKELASLISNPEKMNSEDYRETFGKLERKRRELEDKSRQLSKDRATKKVNYQQIVSSQDSAYLDFAAVKQYAFQETSFEQRRRYLVFVLSPGTSPRLEDLGYSEPIDRRIEDYLRIISAAGNHEPPPDQATLTKELEGLYHYVLEPLLPYLKGKKQLIIHRDDNFSFIPFDAFVTPDGKYLSKDISIDYVEFDNDSRLSSRSTAPRYNTPITTGADDHAALKEEDESALHSHGKAQEVPSDQPSAGQMRLSAGHYVTDSKDEPYRIHSGQFSGATPGMDWKASQAGIIETSNFRGACSDTPSYPHLKKSAIQQRGPDGATQRMRDASDPSTSDNPIHRSNIVLAAVDSSLLPCMDVNVIGAGSFQIPKLHAGDRVIMPEGATRLGLGQKNEDAAGLKRVLMLAQLPGVGAGPAIAAGRTKSDFESLSAVTTAPAQTAPAGGVSKQQRSVTGHSGGTPMQEQKELMDAYWNAWFEDPRVKDDHKKEEKILKSGQGYELVLDISRFKYFGDSSLRADPRIQDKIKQIVQTTPNRPDFSFTIRPIIHGDVLRFKENEPQSKELTVNIQELARKDDKNDLEDLFNAKKISLPKFSEEVKAGKVRFSFVVEKPGEAAISISIWNELGMFPLDHLTVSIQAIDQQGEPEKQDDDINTVSRRGGPCSLLNVPLDFTSNGALKPDAAFYIFEPAPRRSDKSMILFAIKPDPTSEKISVYAWRTQSLLSRYLDVNFYDTLKNARDSFSYANAAEALKEKFFTKDFGDNEGNPDAALAALQDLVRRKNELHERAIVFVRMRKGTDAYYYPPLGILAGDKRILDNRITLVQPLPRERYPGGAATVKTWTLGVPKDLEGLNTEEIKKTLVDFKPADRFRFCRDITELGNFFKSPKTKNPEGIVILAHHGGGVLWFTKDDKDKKITPEKMNHEFVDGSIAFLSACSTAAGQNDNQAILKNLNIRGIDAIIASPFPVDLGYGTMLAEHFAQILDEKKEEHEFTIAKLLKNAAERTNVFLKKNLKLNYEDMDLEFMILGDYRIIVAPKSEEGETNK